MPGGVALGTVVVVDVEVVPRLDEGGHLLDGELRQIGGMRAGAGRCRGEREEQHDQEDGGGLLGRRGHRGASISVRIYGPTLETRSEPG